MTHICNNISKSIGIINEVKNQVDQENSDKLILYFYLPIQHLL